MKKILLFLLIGFAFINCSALTYRGCDYSTVSRMKSIVSNINVSYDYTIIDNEPHFNVTINNLTNDIYFLDTTTGKNYYYSDTNNGEITIYDYNRTSGRYKFYSNIGDCYGISLGTKYFDFPIYNRYYNHELCSDVPNYSLCQKWVNVNYSEEEFEKLVFDYKNSKNNVEEEKIQIEYEKNIIDIIVDLYINYYYYFLIGLILICTTIIIVNNKKNRFKL